MFSNSSHLWSNSSKTLLPSLKETSVIISSPLSNNNWVEPTDLKNMTQIGNLPQIGVKVKKNWKHHPVIHQQRTVNTKHFDNTQRIHLVIERFLPGIVQPHRMKQQNHRMTKRLFNSWSLNQPIWKISYSQIGWLISPQIGVKVVTNHWNQVIYSFWIHNYASTLPSCPNITLVKQNFETRRNTGWLFGYLNQPSNVACASCTSLKRVSAWRSHKENPIWN